jgi:hypothetical protein
MEDNSMVTYSVKDEFEDIRINVSSPSIIFHDGEELFKIARGCKIKPLVLYIVSDSFMQTVTKQQLTSRTSKTSFLGPRRPRSSSSMMSQNSS